MDMAEILRSALKSIDEAYEATGFIRVAKTSHDRLRIEEEIRRLDERPRVVCLCGSTRFRDAFERAQREETLAGRIVLTVGMFGHLEGIDMDGPVKAGLDRLHLKKIDLADEVLVLNCGGYVGESTRREIEHARATGKPIRWLEPVDDLKGG